MSDNVQTEGQTKLYEGKPVTDQDLNRIREDLPEEKHLIETNPGEFHALGRLKG